MSKNVPTNIGSGGDSIYTEWPGGAGPVFGVTKIHTGALDVDGGPVTGSNPLDVRGNGDLDTVGSGTISATDAVVAAPGGAGATVTGTSTAGSYVVLACPGGDSSWNLQLSGTFGGGAVYYEVSLDSTNGIDGNWIAVNGRQTGVVNTVLANSTTSAGIFRGNTSGAKYFRARIVGATAPTVAVVIRHSTGIGAVFLNASIPGGTNIIGSVKITDGTTVPAVKAASTLVAATDPALVVALSPLGGEVSVTGSLNALNAALTIDAKGHAGVSLFITSGTLVGTLIFECSGDGGATWGFTYGSEWSNGIFALTFAATSPNTAGDVITLVMLGGISLYRVRVTAYTSGSMTASLRANDAAGGVANFTNYPGFGAPPYSSMMGAQDGAALIQNLQVRPSTQAAGVQGLITRPYQATDGTNLTPTMDAVARKGFQAITDGTNTAAVLTANPVSASPGLVVRPMFPTDGTNVQPAMASLSTRGFQQITDGTNSAAVKAASTAPAAADPALVVTQSPNRAEAIGATSALNALNATASVNATGYSSVGMFLAAGTLIGTIVTEVSYDGGTTWVATLFDNPVTGAKVASFVFGSANTATSSSIVGNAGSSQYRVRVSAFTSGTANCALRANDIRDPSVLYTAPPGTAVPSTAVSLGASDGANLQTLRVKAASTAAVTTDPALVVALSPNQTDLVASSALGALNAAVVLNAAGAAGVGFNLPSSTTLIGTLVAEVSFDGGTTWIATFFGNTTTGQKAASVTASSGGAMSFSILPCAGGSNYRVRVSAYTSGTGTATLRSSTIVDTSLLYGAPPGGNAAAGMQIGGRDASFAYQYAEIRPGIPSGAAVQGLIVRPYMQTDGTNTVVLKAASTAAATTDPAMVVAVSPNTAVKVVQQNATAGQTNVAASVSSVTLLASNTNRKGATIVNDSASVLYVLFGATASTTVFTVKMQPGDYYEVPFGYTGIIVGIWVTATGSARMTEIT